MRFTSFLLILSALMVQDTAANVPVDFGKLPFDEAIAGWGISKDELEAYVAGYRDAYRIQVENNALHKAKDYQNSKQAGYCAAKSTSEILRVADERFGSGHVQRAIHMALNHFCYPD